SQHKTRENLESSNPALNQTANLEPVQPGIDSDRERQNPCNPALNQTAPPNPPSRTPIPHPP
ncbi:hypothetical protein, partial [Caballeronia sp. LjRoot29]|uniref:hypothetical protein n=1 Tax=Caballeronia sp. LjRoot29 TaxID=3342315 RepID=UPI003F505AC7